MVSSGGPSRSSDSFVDSLDSEIVFEARGLWATYPGLREPVLRDVSVAVPRGALVAVLGPNGGGKSTLIKAALGLVPAVQGEVRLLGGHSPSQVRGRVGYVPQTELVDWHFPVSVFDVVLMGRYGRMGLLRRPGEADRAAARRALERVGLLSMADRQIGELSGGQQQRAFLARALCAEPELLLLDEPMSGVDAPTEHEVLDLLDSLRAEGVTIIMATHDLSCVAERFDRLLLLNRGVVAYGPAAEVFSERYLRETYGSHLVLVPVGGRFLAVEDGAHHEQSDPTHERERARAG